MKNVYVVKLGNLYFKLREVGMLGSCLYKMVNNLNDASFCKDFDYAKKRAEEIGGKVYKVNLEEAK